MQGGSTLWSRPLTSENVKLVQREDIPEGFRKIYYTDIEDNKNVIFGIDVMGKVIFKSSPSMNPIDIFAYRNNIITVNNVDSVSQTITVLDRLSGKSLCESNALTPFSTQAISQSGNVYLFSPADISAFQTCASD